MTERRTSEKESEKRTHRYRALVEASHDVTTTIDTDGTMTYVSPPPSHEFSTTTPRN
jgi:PAS domain-containing protein